MCEVKVVLCWDEAYVALRNLLRARYTTPRTRKAVERAVREIEKEAITQTLLDEAESEQEQPKRAA